MSFILVLKYQCTKFREIINVFGWFSVICHVTICLECVWKAAAKLLYYCIGLSNVVPCNEKVRKLFSEHLLNEGLVLEVVLLWFCEHCDECVILCAVKECFIVTFLCLPKFYKGRNNCKSLFQILGCTV